MGVAIYPHFDLKVPRTSYGDEGKVLVREIEILDNVADQAGITRLSSFGDNREVPEDFDGDPDELEELMGPFEEWFPVEAGIAMCRDLTTAIQNQSDIEWSRHDSETVIDCLGNLREALEAAIPVNARFRLEIY